MKKTLFFGFSNARIENADVLLNACKHIGSAPNTGKPKYMEVGLLQGLMTNEQVLFSPNTFVFSISLNIKIYKTIL
jgi:hypothetical protein